MIYRLYGILYAQPPCLRAVFTLHQILTYTSTSNLHAAVSAQSQRRQQAVQLCDCGSHAPDADVVNGGQRLRCLQPLCGCPHDAPPEQLEVLADHLLHKEERLQVDL
jgi:hypothetical protein